MPKFRAIPDFTKVQLARFWYNVAKHQDCWCWCGPVNSEGRGLFCYGSHQSRLASRIMYYLHNGKIDNNLQVHHSCDNPNCVKPAHMTQGTQLENVHQMFERGRAARLKGEQHGRSILTNAQVDNIVAKILAGATNVELAREFGVNYRTISRIRTGKHTATRGKTLPTSRGCYKLTPVDCDEIRTRFAKGESFASIGRVFGVYYTTISRLIKGGGLGFRN